MTDKMRGLDVQVLVVPSLVAVVKFGQQKLWTFPAAPSVDDLSAGSFSSGSTAVIPGHQGSWVAEQVCMLHTILGTHVQDLGANLDLLAALASICPKPYCRAAALYRNV